MERIARGTEAGGALWYTEHVPDTYDSVGSPFLAVPPADWVASNDLAFAVRDRYPVSPGHTLIVPRRLVRTWFDASAAEKAALLDLVDRVKADLDEALHPDGYNVGFNAGEAAGQTVMHLHVHVIPRFRGDMDDPRGGVRHVIPSRGNYLAKAEPLATGGEGDPFSRHLLPLFLRARTIDVVAAFVQMSGLTRIAHAVDGALARGAHVRVVTGDYLALTQVAALELLLDWQATSSAPPDEGTERPAGRLEARVVEVDRLPGRSRSFHPKAWRFEGPDLGVAFVGSSNLSLSALDTGVEWNLRVERDRDAVAWTRVGDAFEALWRTARPLDAPWIEAYQRRARNMPRALPPGETEEEVLPPPDPPHEVQAAALDALRSAREDRRRRALVVLATGLGKTWLAAYDYLQLWDELGRRPRLLFVAHRRELLRQAARTWRRLLRVRDTTARVGWFLEDSGDLDADLVFASVAKLTRPEHRARLATQAFDYVVVDEVHHAAADSYRRILALLDPVFLLGLTATPERADSADIHGMFDDFVAYRAGIDRGIAVKRLVPFHYFGVKDDIAYENIPWRNGRFDPDRLAAAAATEARMQTLWGSWVERPGSRTLVFCCSVAHARFVKQWLAARGVRVAAVYSEPGSDDRDLVLDQLARGELDAVCAVDVFNEGVDVPAIDRVVMLRPTESGVVFLQQLGRGLRAAEGKSALTVIDFVGNHRVFLERVRTLLSLGAAGGRTTTVADMLRTPGPVELPAGCSVDIEVEAKHLLERLFGVGGGDQVERAYREFRAARGERPHAGELLRMGYTLAPLRQRHGGWFDFVAVEGDLSDEHRGAWEIARAFLRELETTEMTRSFKMVTLQVLLEDESLAESVPLDHVALRAWAILRRSPELLADVPDAERPSETTDERERKRWLAYWRRNPIAAWSTPKKDRRAWFAVADERIRLDLAVPPELVGPLAELVRELVDLRLLQYRRRNAPVGEGFVCRVTWNQRDPILALPRGERSRLPSGETDVRLPDGAVWQFRFAKEFCNVARPLGETRNRLPDFLREWFGPGVGTPGRVFHVRFVAAPDGLWVEPVGGQVVELAEVRGILAYPDLRAAAGHADTEVEPSSAERVVLPIPEEDARLFAVRVAGTSMDGGVAPLRDGDWAVLRPARGAPADSVANRVVLVQTAGAAGSRFQLKRLTRTRGGWRLVSDNPDGPSFDANEDMTVIARLERAVRPEDLVPAPGSVVTMDDLARRFGGVEVSPTTGRYGGHLTLFLSAKGDLEAPDLVRAPVGDRRPAETVYVVARVGDDWRYLGVGRWREDLGRWQIPEVDFPTWRALGEGRSASRELPEGCRGRAQALVDAFLRLPESDRFVEEAGVRGRVLGTAARGGLRLAGGDGGFAERTVSLTDLAWVFAAADDVARRGGVLDAARVHRLRYLDGTPAGSTRFIDTPWALALWRKGAPLVPVRWSSGPLRVWQEGVELDATFSVEEVDGRVSVALEARGGTTGSDDARNTDYRAGLVLLLERLGRMGLRLADAEVDSARTRELPPEDRRIPMDGYPLALDDADSVARALMRGQAVIGREPGARGGGNTNRRIRLVVAGAATGADVMRGLVGQTG